MILDLLTIKWRPMTVTSWKLFTIAFSIIVLASIMLLPFWSPFDASLDIEDTPLYSWGVNDDRHGEDLNAQVEQILSVDLEKNTTKDLHIIKTGKGRKTEHIISETGVFLNCL